MTEMPHFRPICVALPVPESAGHGGGIPITHHLGVE